jgi:hypothetical protein
MQVDDESSESSEEEEVAKTYFLDAYAYFFTQRKNSIHQARCPSSRLAEK